MRSISFSLKVEYFEQKELEIEKNKDYDVLEMIDREIDFEKGTKEITIFFVNFGKKMNNENQLRKAIDETGYRPAMYYERIAVQRVMKELIQGGQLSPIPTPLVFSGSTRVTFVNSDSILPMVLPTVAEFKGKTYYDKIDFEYPTLLESDGKIKEEG